jgi:RHS repeat-associated protein
MTNPLGATTTMARTDRGDVLSITEANGAVTSYAYDGVGRTVQVIDSDGLGVRMRYGGYNVLVGMDKPNNTSFALRYDLEGNLLQLVNEKGEIHSYEYDAQGFCVREKFFDGREQHYRHDAMGKIVRHASASGAVTEFEYDLDANLIERRFSDGNSEQFEWSPTGELIAAKSTVGSWRFQRDALDRVVAEEHTFDGQTYTLSMDYDAMDELRQLSTSLGHVRRFDRDALGNTQRVHLDNATHEVVNDAVGREIGRVLPGGGRVESHYDVVGNLIRRSVSSPLTHKPLGNQPEWIGKQRAAYSVDMAYQYGLGDELLTAWDQLRGITRFEHDKMSRLAAVLPPNAPPELFAYDETDNVREVGPGAPARVYGPGDRLLQRGDVEYVWDQDAQLVERIHHLPDGTDGTWSYRWGVKGTLDAVTRPDGTSVEFLYDPFYRRVAKRVTDRDGNVTVTHFVWHEYVLAHEIKKTIAGGAPIVEERTYCFEDGGFEPWAHRDRRIDSGGQTATGWFHYVNDTVHAPSHIVDDAGAVACSLRRTAWGTLEAEPGARTTTQLRLLGQYYDDETGLSYNMHRYYEPETGRFISPDPIGLAGGNNLFQYPTDPYEWLDPYGLLSANTKELNDNMKKEGRGCSAHETPHHVVQRRGGGAGGKRARAILKRNGIKLNDAANGAKLKGAHPSQRKKGGHKKGCKGYHGGGDIHGAAAQKKVADELEAAEKAAEKKASKKAGATPQDIKDAKAAAVEAKLREIAKRQESRKQGNR